MTAEKPNHDSNGGRNRRGRYLIYRSLQLRCALTTALFIFATSSLMSSALYFVLHRQARQRLLDPQNYVGSVGTVILFAALAFSALTALGFAFWSVRMTHRICGPLWVLNRGLRELAAGRLPDVRPLRTRDELKDLHESFGAAVESLRAQKGQQLQQVADMQAALDAIGGEQLQGCEGHLQSLAADIECMRRELADSLSASAVPIFRDESPADDVGLQPSVNG